MDHREKKELKDQQESKVLKEKEELMDNPGLKE